MKPVATGQHEHMGGISYISGQRIRFEPARFWSMTRTIPYRIIGVVFIALGALPLPIILLHHPPWWFYLLPLFLLIPGIIIAFYSEGVSLYAGSGIIEKWWKIYRFKWYRQSALSEIEVLYINTRAFKNTGATGIVYEVILKSKDGKRVFKAYSAYKESDARKELKRITSLSGLVETDPPNVEITMRQAVVLVLVILLLPLIILAGLLVYKAVK